MSTRARTLYGSTNKSGTIPPARTVNDVGVCLVAAEASESAPSAQNNAASGTPPRNAGPVFAPDGKLIVDQSFTELSPLADPAWFEAGLRQMIKGSDYVESWRLWDCTLEDWAKCSLTLYRFDMFDLVIRREGRFICTWRGALDVRDRVRSSLDGEDYRRNLWQWLRCDR